MIWQENIRNDMISGQPIQRCEVCYQTEKNGNVQLDTVYPGKPSLLKGTN